LRSLNAVVVKTDTRSAKFIAMGQRPPATLHVEIIGLRRLNQRGFCQPPAFPGAVVALADFATEVLKHDAISTLARSNFTAPALGKGRPCSFTRRGMLGSLNDSAKHQYIGR
jgi:hypothetical protein